MSFLEFLAGLLGTILQTWVLAAVGIALLLIAAVPLLLGRGIKTLLVPSLRRAWLAERRERRERRARLNAEIALLGEEIALYGKEEASRRQRERMRRGLFGRRDDADAP